MASQQIMGLSNLNMGKKQNEDLWKRNFKQMFGNDRNRTKHAMNIEFE